MKKIASVFTLVFLLLVASIASAATAVPIVFEIPSSLKPTDVHIQFISTTGITGTFVNATDGTQNLTTTQNYSLAELTGKFSVGGGAPANKPAVLISNFVSGRVFVTIGNSTAMSPVQQAAPQTPTDPNYYERYQYFEPTIVGGEIHVDLSYIDFAAIALTMEAKNSPNAQFSPQSTTVTSKVLTDRLALTSMVADSGVISGGNKLPSEKFARVLAPNTPTGAALYPDWSYYLTTTLQGKKVRIKGLFSGTQNAAGVFATKETQGQNYDYIVTFDAGGNATFTPNATVGTTGSSNVAGITDKPFAGVGNGAGTVVTVSFAELSTAGGIYQNSPKYNVGGGGLTAGIVNDFYGWIVGDLLAGLSWGFPGSTVQFGGTAIGDMYSANWWGGTLEDGTKTPKADTPAGNGTVFGLAQLGTLLKNNFHTYAAALNGITPGYGFALQDRLGENLMHFDTGVDENAYLLVQIEPEAKASVHPSPGQAPGATTLIRATVIKEKNAGALKAEYLTDNFDPITSVCSFNGTVVPSGLCATFMMDTHKTPTGKVSDITLMKLYSAGTSTPYTYAPTGANYEDGYWWLTDAEYNHLTPNDTVIYGTQYYIHFVVKDNGSFDEDSAAGYITDPVSAGVATVSGGCVLNPASNVSYELGALLVAALIIGCLRRRRSNN